MPAEKDQLEKIEHLLTVHRKGLTIADISRKLDVTRNSVAKYLDILISSGRAERHAFGNTGVYFLSHRVPVSTVLDFASDLVIMLDDRGRIVQVNEALVQFFSKPREAFIGIPLDEAPVEMIRALCDLDEKSRVPGGTPTETSFDLQEKKYYFRIKFLPTLFDDGQHGLTIIAENITTQKNYEQELIRSERRYRAIVEDQTELICRRLPDGTITFLNEAFARYFSKSPKDLVGTCFYPTSPGSGETGTSHVNAPASQMGTVEERVLLDNGAIRWIQWKNRALFDADGGITEIQSVGRDITGQREREREILLRDCPIGRTTYPVILHDIVARVIFFNNAALSLFRYTDDQEIIGQPLEQWFARSSSRHNIHQLAAVLLERGHNEGIAMAQKRDGTRFEIEVYMELIKDDINFPQCGVTLVLEHGAHLANNTGRAAAGDGHQLAAFPEACANDDGSSGMYHPPADSGKGEDSYSIPELIPEQTGPEILPGKQPNPPICGENPTGSRHPSFAEMDIIPQASYIIDQDKRVIFWNRAMEAFTGIKEEEVLGTSRYRDASFSIFKGMRPVLIDLLDLPEDIVTRDYPDVRRYGDTLILESYVPGFKGTGGAYIYSKAAYLVDKEGNPIGSLESVCDITEWKNAQESFRRMKNEIDGTFAKVLQRLEGRIGCLHQEKA